MKFTLEIQLGNDAMQTPADVASALEFHMATSRHWPSEFEAGQSGPIPDLNGNTVGKWEVSE